MRKSVSQRPRAAKGLDQFTHGHSRVARFYEVAFEDATLDKFLRSHDDPHGDRFAKWIHQKLSGSNVWDKDRSQRSHIANI